MEKKKGCFIARAKYALADRKAKSLHKKFVKCGDKHAKKTGHVWGSPGCKAMMDKFDDANRKAQSLREKWLACAYPETYGHFAGVHRRRRKRRHRR